MCVKCQFVVRTAILMAVALFFFTDCGIAAQENSDALKNPYEGRQDLVAEGYLRAVPIDPITGNDQWRLINEDSLTAVDQTEPGIYDISSLSDLISLEGTPYSEW